MNWKTMPFVYRAGLGLGAGCIAWWLAKKYQEFKAQKKTESAADPQTQPKTSAAVIAAMAANNEAEYKKDREAKLTELKNQAAGAFFGFLTGQTPASDEAYYSANPASKEGAASEDVTAALWLWG